jgi:transposase-like protein
VFVPGISMAAVALQNQLNANPLRRWVNEASVRREQSTLAPVAVMGLTAAEAAEVTRFVPVKLAASKASNDTIATEVRRGPVLVKLSWHLTAMRSAVPGCVSC